MSKIDIIYIAPMGYSGSTLLDLALNQHKDIQSVGEVNFLPVWINENLICTCEKKIQDCEFWNNVIVRANATIDYNQFEKKIYSFTSYGITKRRELNEFIYQNYELFSAVKKESKSKYILDSSKNLGRLERLLNSNQFDIKIIHLIRNPISVANSSLKKKKRLSFKGNKNTQIRSRIKSLIRWYLVNKRLEKISANYNATILKIKFEDFINHPNYELNRILSFLELESIEFSRSILKNNVHNISGNRWRFEKDISIKKHDKEDESLRFIEKIVFKLFVNKYYKKYTYAEK